MDDKSETTFLVALSDQKSYEKLSRSELRKRLRDGRLRESHLIWHPSHQSWKPARLFPDLKHTGRMPVPASSTSVEAVSADPAQSPPSQAANPKMPVVRPAISRATGKGAPVPKAAPVIRTRAKKISPEAQNEINAHYRRLQRRQIIYGVLTLFCLVLILLLNWLTVDRPLNTALARSEFKNSVGLHGYYRYFVTPGNIVISFGEISSDMTGEKFVEMLTTLAIATQRRAVTGSHYNSVALAKGWETRYLLHGEAWKELADERDLPPARRAMLLADNLFLPNGKHALGEQSDNLRILFDQKGKLFTDFYKGFVGKHP